VDASFEEVPMDNLVEDKSKMEDGKSD
jgi:hypothetical protein